MTRRTSPARWAEGLLTIVAVVGLCVLVSEAEPSGLHGFGWRNDPGYGDLNPTNTAVVDTDFDALSMTFAIEEQVAVEEARIDATGRGIVVAVLDGGFNTNHPRIAASVSPLMWDVLDGDSDPNDPGNGVDDDGDGRVDEALGHGTFVAGMVLSVAPDAVILPIRIADDEGRVLERHVLMGLNHAIQAGADVVNLSLEAGELHGQVVSRILERIEESGIVLVTSAGNAGSEDLNFLALSPLTITVGSVDERDVIAPFSNFPPAEAVNGVFAPGVALFGPIGYPAADSMGYWSGTSFSSGIVSGGVALAKERHPDLTPEEICRLVVKSVDPAFDCSGNIYPYAGRINLAKVVSW